MANAVMVAPTLWEVQFKISISIPSSRDFIQSLPVSLPITKSNFELRHVVADIGVKKPRLQMVFKVI